MRSKNISLDSLCPFDRFTEQPANFAEALVAFPLRAVHGAAEHSRGRQKGDERSVEVFHGLSSPSGGLSPQATPLISHRLFPVNTCGHKKSPATPTTGGRG